MEVKMDNRSTLSKLIENMSDTDLRQVLAYAVGYEAGKVSQQGIHNADNQRNPTKQLV